MVMAAVAWAMERSLHGLVAGDGFAARLIRVAAAIGVGLAVLAIVSHLLRVPEVDEVRTLVRRRLWRKTS
jgi:hypothetical protein